MIFSTSQTNALKKAFNRTSGMRRIVLTTAVAVFGATAGIQMNLAHAQDDAPFCDQGDRGAQRGGSRSHHRMAQHEAGMPGMLGSPRHLDRMVEREGLPLRDSMANLDAEETECPACMTKFKTAGVERCPDCGLNFQGR